jgi:hypothetical protein
MAWNAGLGGTAGERDVLLVPLPRRKLISPALFGLFRNMQRSIWKQIHAQFQILKTIPEKPE